MISDIEILSIISPRFKDKIIYLCYKSILLAIKNIFQTEMDHNPQKKFIF